MDTSSEENQNIAHKEIFLYGGISVLLLLLSSGFVSVIYSSTIGFLEQIYVAVTTWIILNIMILPGLSKVQRVLKKSFRMNKKSQYLGYLVYIVVPPLLFNGLLYQFKYLTGLFEFVLYILIPTSVTFIISVTNKIFIIN